MKKTLLVIVSFAVVSYPAASWYLGSRIESDLQAHYRQVESTTHVRVIEHQYERGVFGATESITLDLLGGVWGDMDPGVPNLPSLRLRFRSRIQHGPIVEGGVALGVMQSELLAETETRAETATTTATTTAGRIGGRSLLTGHTVFRLDGGGTARFRGPAFTSELNDPTSDETIRFVWGGIRSDVEFAPEMQGYRFRGSAPRLEIESIDGVLLAVRGMAFSGEKHRLFEDDPFLHTGTRRFDVDHVRIAQEEGFELTLDRFTHDVETAAEGDFVDVIARVGVEAFEAGGTRYGPADCDFSIRHLHGRALAGLHRHLLEIYSDRLQADDDDDGEPDAEAGARQQTPLAQSVRELLAHQPSIHLDRLSLQTEQGALHLEAHVRSPGIGPEGFGDSTNWMDQLDARARIVVPEALVIRTATERASLSSATVSESGAASEADVQRVSAQTKAWLDQLIGRGLIRLEADDLVWDLTLQDGQILLNGRPLDQTDLQMQ